MSCLKASTSVANAPVVAALRAAKVEQASDQRVRACRMLHASRLTRAASAQPRPFSADVLLILHPLRGAASQVHVTRAGRASGRRRNDVDGLDGAFGARLALVSGASCLERAVQRQAQRHFSTPQHVAIEGRQRVPNRQKCSSSRPHRRRRVRKRKLDSQVAVQRQLHWWHRIKMLEPIGLPPECMQPTRVAADLKEKQVCWNQFIKVVLLAGRNALRQSRRLDRWHDWARRLPLKQQRRLSHKARSGVVHSVHNQPV